MTELPDEAVAEIAARMFDGDLSRQPQQVQDKVWRDARFALAAAVKHLPIRTPVQHCSCSACGKAVVWEGRGWGHLDGTDYCFSVEP